MDEHELIDFLDRNSIRYIRFEHDAVYTCEESNRLLPDISGARTKNLLLCDERKERWFFLMFLDHKRVDFKRLAKSMETGKVSFAAPENMQKILGISPGSVNIFALANDSQGIVEVFLDQDLWNFLTWHAHPMVNTATLEIARDGVERFFKIIRHPYRVIEIPEKK